MHPSSNVTFSLVISNGGRHRARAVRRLGAAGNGQEHCRTPRVSVLSTRPLPGRDRPRSDILEESLHPLYRTHAFRTAGSQTPGNQRSASVSAVPMALGPDLRPQVDVDRGFRGRGTMARKNTRTLAKQVREVHWRTRSRTGAADGSGDARCTEKARPLARFSQELRDRPRKNKALCAGWCFDLATKTSRALGYQIGHLPSRRSNCHTVAAELLRRCSASQVGSRQLEPCAKFSEVLQP